MGLAELYDVQATVIKGRQGTASEGTEFNFEGLRQNISNIKSHEGADRAWVEEAQTVSKSSWEVLIPTIRKDGSEIWMTFNPEFEDDYTYERFVLNPPEFATVININYRDNPWFPAVLEQERLDLKKRDPDSYDHVWEGRCKQWLEGAIYANELRQVIAEGRITKVEHDPVVPVFTAWDLGRTDDTAIWWYQIVRGEIHVLECYASNGGSLSEYATQVLGKETEIDLIGQDVVATIGSDLPDLEHRRSYQYDRHWLPHDALAKTLAAKGKSTVEQLAAALKGRNLSVVPEIGVEQGIQAARMAFKRCWFDEDGCVHGLKALRGYKREMAADEVSFQRNPKHDWTSHYADAFRMMAVAWQNPLVKEAPKKIELRGPLTIGEMIKASEKADPRRARI